MTRCMLAGLVLVLGVAAGAWAGDSSSVQGPPGAERAAERTGERSGEAPRGTVTVAKRTKRTKRIPRPKPGSRTKTTEPATESPGEPSEPSETPETLSDELSEVPEHSSPTTRPQEQQASERIFLEGNDLTLALILDQLMRGHQLVLEVAPEVDLNRSIQFTYLRDVSLSEALTSILAPVGYSFQIEGRLLEIFSRTTRSFPVRVPMIVQDWKASVSNEASGGAQSAGSGSGQGAKVLVSGAVDSKGIWSEIDAAVKTMLTKDGTYAISRVAGLVTVTDTPSAIGAVEGYIKALNREMRRQALIEVRVAEVSLRDEHAAGIDWNLVIQSTGLPRIAPIMLDTGNIAGDLIGDSAMAFSVSSVNGGAMLKAIEQQGHVEVVAQPSLVVGNNLPAIIQVANVRTYVNNLTVTQIAQAGTQTTVETAILSDGLILGLLPRINDDGAVVLGISVVLQDILNISRASFSGGFVELPKTARRSYVGVNEISPSQTLVIAGLLSTRESDKDVGIPFLSKIPVVGILFGGQETLKEKVELVIMVTVRAVEAYAAGPRTEPTIGVLRQVEDVARQGDDNGDRGDAGDAPSAESNDDDM